MKNLLLLSTLIVLFSCVEKKQPADTVVYGKIWTGNESQPYAEAMAIRSDSIISVGSRNDIELFEGAATEKIEAIDGQLIVPGFIDTHTHFVEGGFRLSQVQLRDAKTP